MRYTLLVFIGLVLCASITPAQAKRPDIEKMHVSIDMTNQSLGTVVQYLMEKYDILIGFEQSSLDKDHQEYDFNTNLPDFTPVEVNGLPPNATATLHRIYKAKNHPLTVKANDQPLRAVLDQMVKQMANYKWSVRDGVVNITPSKGRDVRFKKLLDLKISEFNVESGRPVRAITQAIRSAPEFQTFLKENDLHFNGIRSGFETILKAQYDRPINAPIHLSNKTLREILNASTKVKRGGWSLRMKRSKEEQHIDIDI